MKNYEGEKIKKADVLAFIALLLGIASPLPIWPGPLLLRHIPPGVLSFILILSAYFVGRKAHSKLAGLIMIAYGLLATIAGILFLSLVLIATSEEFLAGMSWIITVGGIVALIAGITSIILGSKMTRKPKLETER